MVNLSVARRYARALLEVAAETHQLEVVSEQLAGFVKALHDSAELSELLLNPVYARTQVTAVVDQIIAGSRLEMPVANLLRLLVDRKRTAFLPDIARLFRDMADQRAGRLRGQLTSAVKLPAQAVEKLTAKLEAVTQRKVLLEERVEPALLGGVSAQVGSVLYDGSLRTQLEELRRSLRAR